MTVTTYIIILLLTCTLISTTGFILNKNHLLISLLYLESFMLALVLLLPISYTIFSSCTIHSSVVILSIAACEARIGLALIVAISRTYGSDIINILSLNKC